METESATTRGKCAHCGQAVFVSVAARSCSDGIRYTTSLRCECGYAIESDDGESPALREVLLVANGPWEVRLVDAGSRRIEVIAAIGRIAGCSNHDALALIQGAPARVIVGTRLEVLRAVDLLRSLGATAHAARVDAPRLA